MDQVCLLGVNIFHVNPIRSDTKPLNLCMRPQMILLLWAGNFISAWISAQPDSAEVRTNRSYQISLHTGFIFAHSEHVENTRGSRPRGVEFSVVWQKNNERAWNLCNCFPQQGIMVAYYDFDNAALGKGFHASYLLEPWYRINSNNYASLKSAAGIVYLTNPHHAGDNPSNQSYSTALSAYLFLGVGWWRKLSDHFWFAPHIQFQHTSNGGLEVPNKGINWPTASLTLSYRASPSPLKTFSRSPWKKENNTRWDVALFGMATREGGKPDGESDRFPMFGLMIQYARQVGHINNITASAEISHDGKLGSRMKRQGVDGEPVRVGILGGHEFIFGRFLFSQRLGVYLYQAGQYFDLLYHRWGLVYRFNDRWSAGFNLKAHRAEAEYTDVRVVYSF